MTCPSCLYLLIVVPVALAVVTAIVWLAVKIIGKFAIVRKYVGIVASFAWKILKIGVGILVLLAIIGTACLSIYVNEGTRIGLAAGALLGVLLGPIRLAGVDFRQWFMDPSAPSEIGDDSFIALIRGGFHALWIPALLAILVMLCTVSLWMPSTNEPGEVPRVSQYLPMLVDLVSSRSGAHGGVNFALGTIVGVIAGPVLVELVWRLGLEHGLLPRAQSFLAPKGLPMIRDKVVVANRRRLIICCDGTWNWPEPQRETNVVRMVRALLPQSNGTPQIIHYHEGVGTGNVVDRIVGGGAGVGLSASVKACYGFLVDNYRDGDEIFLFGFSRGAFVVRSLAGVIGAVGMMRKIEMVRFSDMWDWYCQGKDVRREETLCEIAPHRYRHVDIECVGVWDTVGALGIPGTRLCATAFQFHDVSLGMHVRHAFQALAIDERRGNFQGAVWVPYDHTSHPRGKTRPVSEAKPEVARRIAQYRQPQVLRQMWFPGVHSNVGGGYLKHGLSDTTFLWMVSQLDEFKLLGFDEASIVTSLDNGDHPPDTQANNKELFPAGFLEDSRTLFWKLIFCPVPRPVCVISSTERMHEIAWDRDNSLNVLAKDIYKKKRRLKWLALNDVASLKTARSPFEIRVAGIDRPKSPVHIDIRPKLGFCGHILKFINPQG